MNSKLYSPGQPYNYQLTLKSLLSKPLVNCPDREIVFAHKSRHTYKTLNQRIHRLASGLSSMGITSGDTVAVFDYDSHRYLECFFAIPMMGAILQTINWRLSPEQIAYTIIHSEAKYIIIHQDFLPVFTKIQDQLKEIRSIILIIEGDENPEGHSLVTDDYESLLADADSFYDFPDFDENTKATTFYTTGTTGNPKGVYFSHRQLMLHTLAIAVELGSYYNICRFRSNDVYMPLTPMFHVHAWGIPYVATLLGTKQVYPGPYEPKKILKLIEDEKVTFSHCVPTILQMIINDPAARQTDLSGWKIVIGGARLPKGLARAAKNFGIDIIGGYGMSETCPVMSLAYPKEHMLNWEEDKLLDITVKTGKPVPLVDVEIIDLKGTLLPHDGASTGEVVMRSPWLTKGYFKAPEKTKILWQNGWLHSGDMGYIDKENYLQITDRIKDVIKSGGEWISSLDLENLLSKHEAVFESAAIGMPDEKWGERPMMIIQLKPEYKEKVTADTFKQFFQQEAKNGKLSRYAVPDRFEIVESIAKTSVGKLDKKVLRKEFT